MLCTLFRNGYRVTTTALANSRANTFALLNIKYAKKIAKFLNTYIETLEKLILVKDYNRQMGTPITSIL
jgi:chloramphenicol O-acetyltransferase